MPYYYYGHSFHTSDPIASQSTSFVRSDDCCIPIFIHDFSKAESRYPILVFFLFEYISIRVSSLMQQFLVFLIFGLLQRPNMSNLLLNAKKKREREIDHHHSEMLKVLREKLIFCMVKFLCITYFSKHL